MKRIIAILIVVLSLFSLVACDYSETVEGYSTQLNSMLHGVLDPYLKEDEKYQDGYVQEEDDQQEVDGSSLSADSEK
ncbi:MAG: hypothetical protein IKB27_01175 [Clostridia bacterium]|nr:hypothetical protein [Clostridia bacterium]